MIDGESQPKQVILEVGVPIEHLPEVISNLGELMLDKKVESTHITAAEEVPEPTIEAEKTYDPELVELFEDGERQIPVITNDCLARFAFRKFGKINAGVSLGNRLKQAGRDNVQLREYLYFKPGETRIAEGILAERYHELLKRMGVGKDGKIYLSKAEFDVSGIKQRRLEFMYRLGKELYINE